MDLETFAILKALNKSIDKKILYKFRFNAIITSEKKTI